MSQDSPQIHPSVLLEHREYLRSLARSLVFDEHRADDLVQQACLALLERPPKRSGSLRAWLGRVIQNLAYSMLAREGERAWREKLAVGGLQAPDEDPSEERIFEEQQLLLDAVRRLRQPYRSTIFLRYYKDLSPTEIAAQEELSLATVKTRLRRGLELLRNDLDASHHGMRGNWCLTLLPFAAPLAVWKLAGAGGAGAATAYLKGILLMKKPIVALLSAVALAGVASLTWVALDGRTKDPSEGSSGTQPKPVLESEAGMAAADGELLPVEAQAAQTQLSARDGLPQAAPSSPVASATDYSISGRVVDESGAPVARADVWLNQTRDGMELSFPSPEGFSSRGPAEGMRRTLTDAKGRFELALGGSGSRHISVGADYFAPFRKEILVDGSSSVHVGDLKLDAGALLAGRVVDSSGAGIPGAAVESLGPKSGPQVFYFGNGRAATLAARTDADGYFSIKRQAVGPWRLRASSPDHPAAEESGQTLRGGERSEGIHIALQRGLEISGSVVGLPDRVPEGLVVVASPSSRGEDEVLLVDGAGLGGERCPVGSSGDFRLRGLRADRDYNLRLVLGDQPFNARRRSESLLASPGASGVRLVYRTPAALLFQVVDAKTGAPIERFDLNRGGFSVRTGEDGFNPLGTPSFHPEGRMRLEDFDQGPGSFGVESEVSIEAVGYEDYQLGVLDMTPGQEVNLGQIRMLAVPVLRVHVRDASTGAPVVGALVSMGPEEEAEPHAENATQRMSFSMDVEAGESSMVFSDGTDDPRVRGVTDAEGLCVLTSLPAESVRIRISHEDHAPYASELLRLPEGLDSEHRATMEEGSTVQVAVVDSEGQPLAGMSVTHIAPDAGTALDPMAIMNSAHQGALRTDSEGMLYFENLSSGTHGFSLDEDPFTSAFQFGGVTLGPPGGRERAPSVKELQVVPGAVLTLTLVAAPRGSLGGVVREGGMTLAGARVKLLPKSDGPGRGIPGMLGSGGPSATTDSKGRYELDAVPSDGYRVEVTHPTRQMPSVLEVAVREGRNDLDIALSVASIEGRITDPEGKPLAGLQVGVSEYQEPGANSGSMRFVAVMVDTNGSSMTITDGGAGQAVSTDGEGYYQLRGVAIDRPLVVEASGSAYAAVKSEPIEVRAGETLDGVDLQLRAAGRVDIEVSKADGSAAGGFLVNAVYRGSADPMPEEQTAFIGPDGKGELQGLLVGSWELSLRAMGGPGGSRGSGASAAPLPQTVEVGAGQRELVSFEAP